MYYIYIRRTRFSIFPVKEPCNTRTGPTKWKCSEKSAVKHGRNMLQSTSASRWFPEPSLISATCWRAQPPANSRYVGFKIETLRVLLGHSIQWSFWKENLILMQFIINNSRKLLALIVFDLQGNPTCLCKFLEAKAIFAQKNMGTVIATSGCTTTRACFQTQKFWKVTCLKHMSDL